MKLASILVVATAALAAGTASVEYKKKPFMDKFDDGTPLTAVDGTAGGHLGYKGFVYTPLVFPRPKSGTQIITTGLHPQALEGQAALMRLNDKMKCFDLLIVNNVCLVNNQVGLASVPIKCTVKFTAHSATPGTEPKTKSVVYDPDHYLSSAFYSTTFPATTDFSCLDRVDITLVSADLPAPGATVEFGLDNVLYLAHLPV